MRDNNGTIDVNIRLDDSIELSGSVGPRPDIAAMLSEPRNIIDEEADRSGWEGHKRKLAHWLSCQQAKLARPQWIEDQITESLRTNSIPWHLLANHEKKAFKIKFQARKKASIRNREIRKAKMAQSPWKTPTAQPPFPKIAPIAKAPSNLLETKTIGYSVFDSQSSDRAKILAMTPSAQIHNMVLDFLYRHICQGKTNQQICQELEKKANMLPPMTFDQLDIVRKQFKEKEASHPEKMAKFRARLGV